MGPFSFLMRIYEYLETKKQQRYLAQLVKHGLRLGKNVGILDGCFLDPSHCYLISIGDNCTLCPNVRLIAHDASTKKILGYSKIGKIDIKEDCFIGDSAIILPGVTIGPNSIVGAGSVVTRDVPSGMVATGNPARVTSTVADYIKRIETLSKRKGIFSREYFIEKLDEKKRKKILQAVQDEIGFII